jgi:HK97 family phage prohead protease
MQEIIRKVAQSDAHPTKGKSRSLDFVFSTNGLDFDLDCVNVSGMDLTQFKRNPVICWNHDWRQLPVGRCDSIYLTADKSAIHGSIEFAETDFAEEVYQLYLGKFLSATSVGFRVLEEESPDWRLRSAYPTCKRHIARSLLLEVSCVVIGSNPNALRKALSSPGLIKSAPISHSIEEAIVASNRTRKSADNTATPRPTSTAEGMEICQKCKKPRAGDVCKCNGGAQGNANGIAAADAVKRMQTAISSSLTEEQRLALAVQNKVKAAIEDGTVARNILEQVATQVEIFSAVKQLGDVLEQCREFAVKVDTERQLLEPGGKHGSTLAAKSLGYGVCPFRAGTSEAMIWAHEQKSLRRKSR